MTDIYMIMHQGAFWRTKDERWKKIRDPIKQREEWIAALLQNEDVTPMDENHASNLLAWLERHCVRIQFQAFTSAMWHLEFINGEMAQESIEMEIDQEFEDSPMKWLEKTELYKSLQVVAKEV